VWDKDFDPYDQLMALTDITHDLARELRNQSETVEQLVHHINVQQRKLRSMNARLLSTELQLKEINKQ
jgi:hypothetical protein